MLSVGSRWLTMPVTVPTTMASAWTTRSSSSIGTMILPETGAAATTSAARHMSAMVGRGRTSVGHVAGSPDLLAHLIQIDGIRSRSGGEQNAVAPGRPVAGNHELAVKGIGQAQRILPSGQEYDDPLAWTKLGGPPDDTGLVPDAPSQLREGEFRDPAALEDFSDRKLDAGED